MNLKPTYFAHLPYYFYLYVFTLEFPTIDNVNMVSLRTVDLHMDSEILCGNTCTSIVALRAVEGDEKGTQCLGI
jgi:hypothetical protein